MTEGQFKVLIGVIAATGALTIGAMIFIGLRLEHRIEVVEYVVSNLGDDRADISCTIDTPDPLVTIPGLPPTPIASAYRLEVRCRK